MNELIARLAEMLPEIVGAGLLVLVLWWLKLRSKSK